MTAGLNGKEGTQPSSYKRDKDKADMSYEKTKQLPRNRHERRMCKKLGKKFVDGRTKNK